MLSIKLAFKNLLGAGLRTWLNVLVLSMAFILILFYNGMIDGWNQQAIKDTKAWEIGHGQIWQNEYDPFDPFTFEDAHAVIPPAYQQQVTEKKLAPILITQASIYPQGRLQSAILKGIPADQHILELPTESLQENEGTIPAMIGTHMARMTKLKKGDEVLIRWRDAKGTFDAINIKIVSIFDTDVPTVDGGQVWVSLENLQKMTNQEGEATLLVAGENFTQETTEGWNFKTPEFLLADLTAIIQTKKGSGMILYGLLMIIALLAIFDTQVLSIFRRQKEIGTYVALGMTRSQVVGLFTMEGAANSVLAAVLGAVYGVPLFYWINKVGIPMGTNSSETGIAISERIFPVYGASLILGTIALIVIAATIVSYLPARKITNMNPTDALKGKLI